MQPDTFRYEAVKAPDDEFGNRVTRIKCFGRLVSGPATGELKEAIKPLIAQGGRIIVDLGEVDYLDSSGPGTAVSLKISAIKQGYRMREFVVMTPRVLELLHILNLAPICRLGSPKSPQARLARRSLNSTLRRMAQAKSRRLLHLRGISSEGS